MNAIATTRGRFYGVAQICRFNWTQYAAAASAILVGIVACSVIRMPGAVAIGIWVLCGAAAYWMISSVVVSHWVYDRSALCKWDWIRGVLSKEPQDWVNIHSGLDESSATIFELFPAAKGRVLNIFDPAEMTEPSIARAQGRSSASSESVSFRTLPLAGQSVDAVFLMLSAHELRSPGSRRIFLKQLQSALRPAGEIVLAEHLRDWANFIAFGPGFLHFHSRSTWIEDARASGLAVRSETRITPFVNVMVFHTNTKGDGDEFSDSL